MKRYIKSATESNIELARNSKDPKVLARLARDEDEHVRREVVDNPNTSADVLAQLANDDDMWVRYYVARNRSTPADVLAQLANDENSRVSACVAENRSTPADVLAQLANDGDELVRTRVAKNPNTPVDIITQFAKDDDKLLRWMVADNSNTPADVLAQLANDEDETVRRNVADNLNTPVDVLVQLANDESEMVSDYAVYNPNYPVKSKKPDKSKKSNDWSSFLLELDEECEEYGDPLYEQSPAGEKLLELCYDVEREMPFWLEPSVQAGQGGIWIYDNETDETLVEDIDYADFNYNVVDMALESGSADEFKQKYKTYLLGLVE